MPDNLNICNGRFLLIDKFFQEFSTFSLFIPFVEVGLVLLFSSTHDPSWSP